MSQANTSTGNGQPIGPPSDGKPSLPDKTTKRSVTQADVVLGENYVLRVQNLSLKKQIKELEAALLEHRLQEQTREMMLYRQKLGEKYGIDFTKEEIDGDTGEIIAAGSKK